MYKSLIVILGLFAAMVQIPTFAQNSNNALAQSKTGNILNRIFDTGRNNYNRNDDYRKYNNDRQNQNQRKRNNRNQNRNRNRFSR